MTSFVAPNAPNTLKHYQNAPKPLKMQARVSCYRCFRFLRVQVWAVETGECLRTLAGHTKSVVALERLDGGLLVSGAYDGSIKIWAVDTGDCVAALVSTPAPLRMFADTKMVSDVAVLDGGLLASISDGWTYGQQLRVLQIWHHYF